jgi:hypothetical protein
MKLNVIKAYVLKELTEIVRSRLIIMVYLMPTMVLVLFGYGIRMEVTSARTLIIDNDQSHYSQLLVSKFEHSKYFDATIEKRGEATALDEIHKAKSDILLIIPESFEKRLLHGQATQIGVFVDAWFNDGELCQRCCPRCCQSNVGALGGRCPHH